MNNWHSRPDPPSVLIISARGPLAGSGHTERCRVLAGYLKDQGIKVQEAGLPLETGQVETASFSGRFSLVVLDARDYDPAHLPFPGPILCLDNRSGSRGQSDRYFFYDTIPHPDLDLFTILRQALVRPIPYDPQKRQVLIYAGSQILPRYLQLLFRGPGSLPVLVVGQSSFAGARRVQRLAPDAFRRELARSRYFFTYYGQSLFESLSIAGLCPVLYSIGSPYHDFLSTSIARQLHIPFLRTVQDAIRWQSQLPVRRTRVLATGRGYELLIGRIKRLLSADEPV